MKRIAVFGIGGIGGYIGARLGSLGGEAELVFVARGAHLKAIQAKGLTYRAPDGTETVVRPALATENPADLGKIDILFLCVKGYDLASACASLAPAVGPETVVIPLLNGADIYERVRSVLSGGTVLPGGIYISSSVAEPGLVVHSGGKGNLFLGAEPGRTGYDPAGLLDLLAKAGIPCEWSADPFPAIWTKFLFIASYGLVTGLSGKTIGEVVADGKPAETVRGIAAEIAAIAAAKGIVLPPDAAAAAFEKGKVFPPATKTSFQRDLEVAGKPNEGDLFGGTILRLGRELGVPTPVTSDTYNRILSTKVGR